MELSQILERESSGNSLISLGDQPVLLKSRILEDTSEDVFKLRIGDVRFGQQAHSSRSSVVDRKKLLAAEKKLAQRRALRKSNVLYAPEIPWDLKQRAYMMVNQSKKIGINPSDKNIGIYNFEIKYPNTTIIENANLVLSYGRRYGLIGKNGIGKSTLLTAISSGELEVPSGMLIQHIEQNVVSLFFFFSV